jgi:hypothetical protein
VLKYFAEKTESTFLQWVYLFGLGMLFFAASAFWEVLRYDHSLRFWKGRLGWFADFAFHIVLSSLLFGLAMAGMITALQAISKAQLP